MRLILIALLPLLAANVYANAVEAVPKILIIGTSSQVSALLEDTRYKANKEIEEVARENGFAFFKNQASIELVNESIFGIDRLEDELFALNTLKEAVSENGVAVPIGSVWGSLSSDHKKLKELYGIDPDSKEFANAKVAVKQRRTIKVKGPDNVELTVVIPNLNPIQIKEVTTFAKHEPTPQSLDRLSIPAPVDDQFVVMTPGLEVGDQAVMDWKIQVLQRLNEKRQKLELEVEVLRKQLKSMADAKFGDNWQNQVSLDDLTAEEKEYVKSMLESRFRGKVIDLKDWKVLEQEMRPSVEFQFLLGVSNGVNVYKMHNAQIGGASQSGSTAIKP